MKIQILLAAITLCLICCKSKYNTPYDYSGSRITFGSGGGFANQTIEYTLLSNSDIYKGTGSEGFVDLLSHKRKDQAKQFFVTYDKMQFDTLHIDETGNMTHYIIMYSEDNKPHKIQWADYVEAVPESLKIFHKNLFAFVRKINSESNNSSAPVK